MKVRKIKELIALVEQSEIAELELTFFGGRKIKISKYPTSPSQFHNPGTAGETVVKEGKPPVAKEEEIKPSELDESGLVPIKSPIVGTFYRAPAPDAPPYVEVGDHISVGEVVCIVEAMKLMNEIKSEISGTVEKILVENAAPVEYGQVLFLIKPG